MDFLIQQLPFELKNLILSYSYKFQPIELRNDIISYYNSKKVIVNLFYLKYNHLLTTSENNIYLTYLIYNLHCFLFGISFYSNCKSKIDKFCEKNYLFKNNLNYTIYKIINMSYPVSKPKLRFGIILGLLDPDERNEFIQINKKFNN